MLVSSANNVKVYNLSCGKSIPEWISDRKKRKLQKDDAELRRRIELIQDFDMPDVSTAVTMTKDGQYIFAAGTYKPRIRCFDVNNLSMKFERCLDYDVIKMLSLGDSYEKLVFLQEERWVEFHVKYGHYFRTRIPKFGRDMAYNSSNAELVIVGASVTGVPSISHIAFKDALTMAVGTTTGQILLYDIRSKEPLLVKDHLNGLPIKSIDFSSEDAEELVLSCDTRALKIWLEKSGKPFTTIEPEVNLNQMCLLPKSGLLFLANEAPKILTYYIPSVGPAPKWCSFLDNITEELEETEQSKVYDDYKFVTAADLDGLGLTHLIGSKMLKAYMHGYFIDMRLYNRAKTLANPFAYEEYRKQKIKEKLDEERQHRLLFKKLPKVNRALAQNIIAASEEVTAQVEAAKLSKKGSKKSKTPGKTLAEVASAKSLLEEDRWKAMWENPDFEIDQNSEQYQLMNPVRSKLERLRQKSLKKLEEMERKGQTLDDEKGEVEVKPGTSFGNDFGEGESEQGSYHSDDSEGEQEFIKGLRAVHRQLYSRKGRKRSPSPIEESEESKQGQKGEGQHDKRAGNVPKKAVVPPEQSYANFVELDPTDNFEGFEALEKERERKGLDRNKTLEDRLANAKLEDSNNSQSDSGKIVHQITFVPEDKRKQKTDDERRQHMKERRKVRRPANALSKSSSNKRRR